MVAFASSSGSHCSSENRKSKLLLPTEELPMRRSLTLMGAEVVPDLVGFLVAVEDDDEGGILSRLWTMLK